MQEDPARTIKFGWFMIAMGVPGREQVPLLVEVVPHPEETAAFWKAWDGA